MRWLSTCLATLVVGFSLPAPASAELVDQRGVRFTPSAQSDPIVLTFVATRCTDACPIANAVFSSAVARATSAGVRGTFVTATLDPMHDTPLVMAEYARRLGADPRRWRFVSGSEHDVVALMQRFGVVAVRTDHTSWIYVSRYRAGKDRAVQTLFLSNDAAERILEILKAESVKSNHHA